MFTQFFSCLSGRKLIRRYHFDEPDQNRRLRIKENRQQLYSKWFEMIKSRAYVILKRIKHTLLKAKSKHMGILQ